MGARKTQWKVPPPKARENFWSLIQVNSLVFVLNNALVYMFPRIQNETLKKERIWFRIRGDFLAKKRAPNLNFHREGGGQLPPSAPLNPPLARAWTSVGACLLLVKPQALNTMTNRLLLGCFSPTAMIRIFYIKL